MRCLTGWNAVRPWKTSKESSTFSAKRFWLSRPKKPMLPGSAAETPDGVGTVRDSARVSLTPVKTRKVSLPRIG